MPNKKDKTCDKLQDPATYRSMPEQRLSALIVLAVSLTVIFVVAYVFG